MVGSELGLAHPSAARVKKGKFCTSILQLKWVGNNEGKKMKKVPPSWLTKGGIVGNLECKGGRGSNPWMEMGWPGSDWGQLKGQLQGGGGGIIP